MHEKITFSISHSTCLRCKRDDDGDDDENDDHDAYYDDGSQKRITIPVSYTHLTLPTSDLV